MSYKLSADDLMQAAKVVRRYLAGSLVHVYKYEASDSMTVGDVRLYYYHQNKNFIGEIFYPGTLNLKGRFEGYVRDNIISVSEESKTNWVHLPVH